MFTLLPMGYWLPVLIVTGLFPILVVLLFLRNFSFVRGLRSWTGSLSGSLLELPGRRIQNLPEVVSLVERIAPESYRKAFQTLQDDHVDLYQSAWIPDPAKYLVRRKALPRNRVRDLGFDFPFQFLWVTGMATLACLLSGAALEPQVSIPVESSWTWDRAVLVFSLIPLGTGILSTAFSFLICRLHARIVEQSLADVNEALTRRLPVFEEVAGTAALIEGFMEYDRRMVQSVGRLTDRLDALASGELSQAVSGSVSDTLRQDVAPALVRADATLSRMAEVLAKNQEEAMTRMATTFADSLSESMAAHMGPLLGVMGDAAKTLDETRVLMDTAVKAMDQYKQDGLFLFKEANKAATRLEHARDAFLADLGNLADHTEALSDASSVLSSLYAGSSTGLTDSIQSMAREMAGFSGRIQEVVVQFQTQLAAVAAQSTEALDRNQAHLSSMQEAIQTLSSELSTRVEQTLLGFSGTATELLEGFRNTSEVQGSLYSTQARELYESLSEEARSMSLYAKEISMDLHELNARLDTAIATFGESMQKELASALGAFDSGLSDVTRRLVQSASEIGDAVELLPETLRSAGREPRS